MEIEERHSGREHFGEVGASTEHAVAAHSAASEREWLEREVAWAASLSDADRVRILRDLLRTADAIQQGKSGEENRRAEEVRRLLDEPGRARYRALIRRLAGSDCWTELDHLLSEYGNSPADEPPVGPR